MDDKDLEALSVISPKLASQVKRIQADRDHAVSARDEALENVAEVKAELTKLGTDTVELARLRAADSSLPREIQQRKQLEQERDTLAAKLASEHEYSSALAGDLAAHKRKAEETQAAAERLIIDRSNRREQTLATSLATETERRHDAETKLTRVEKQLADEKMAHARARMALEAKIDTEHRLADEARRATEDVRKTLSGARNHASAEVDSWRNKTADAIRTAGEMTKARDAERAVTGGLRAQIKSLKDEVSTLTGKLMAAQNQIDREAGGPSKEELNRQIAVLTMQINEAGQTLKGVR